MTTTVFIEYANLNQLSLTELLNSPLLSQQAIDYSEEFNDNRKKQYLACRYLLANLLKKHYQISSLPETRIGDNQRPYFYDKNLPDFNISHSGDFVAVAISSQGRIGLDIEQVRPRANLAKIANQFFSPIENNWLAQQQNQTNAFWQLWTLREAALKLYAKGVWQMKEMEIVMPKQQITAKFGSSFYSYHQQTEQLHLSVCCDNNINKIFK